MGHDVLKRCEGEYGLTCTRDDALATEKPFPVDGDPGIHAGWGRRRPAPPAAATRDHGTLGPSSSRPQRSVVSPVLRLPVAKGTEASSPHQEAGESVRHLETGEPLRPYTSTARFLFCVYGCATVPSIRTEDYRLNLNTMGSWTMVTGSSSSGSVPMVSRSTSSLSWTSRSMTPSTPPLSSITGERFCSIVA